MFLTHGLMIDYFFPLLCYFITSPILPFLPFLGVAFSFAQTNPPALLVHMQLGLLSALTGALLALITPNNLAFLGWTRQLLKTEKVELQTGWITLGSFIELILYLLTITFIGTWLAHNISATLFQAFGVGGVAFILTCAIERFTLLGVLLGSTRHRGKQITFQKIPMEGREGKARLELRLTPRP
jgi:hypothetical protein